MSNFNYSLRFGQVGLDIDVPLRISALHFMTCYGFIKIHSTRFNYSLRFGQVNLDAHVLLRISACVFLLGRFCGFLRIVAGYGISLTEEIEAHGLPICPEVSLLTAKSR